MSSLRVSVPDERLEKGIRARLSADELARIEIVRWDMTAPAPADEIDLVVAPYNGGGRVLPQLVGVRTQLVQSQSIGYEWAEANLPDGHRFANAASVHETATAELALALTLAAQRRIPKHVLDGQQGIWDERFAPSLADRRVLVLGYGGVGKATIARLEPFETEITVVASRARDEDGRHVHGIDELPALLADAEIVIGTLPATEQTVHLIDDAALSLLPDGALVVNVGRGSLIDTEALVEHVSRGRIRAALDVVETEPLPAGHALWTLPGVLITPHVGGTATSMAPRMNALVADQIRRLLAGEQPRNVVLEK